MSVIAWLRERVCRLPLPAHKALPEHNRPRTDLDPKVCADKIEADMDRQFAANSRAAMASLAVEQEAITAEERGRQMLDELMRSMDRGKDQ